MDSDEFPMDLPPGFRFHPSDEELITHYLNPKVLDGSFSTAVIGDVDLNKVEPWDLPWKAKIGEKEWYFFCLRDRKYPTGSRTNRATQAGFWKATGKDKQIYALKSFLGIGMKKTLVFYTGRAPKGEKSNWVMHEYRLLMQGNISPNLHNNNNEWVICRVFKKAPGGKKIHISCLAKNHGRTSGPHLPSLVDLEQTQTTTTEGFNHVTCFSNSTINSSQPAIFQDYSLMQDQSMLHLLLDTRTPLLSSGHTTSMKLYDDQEFPGISMGQVDLDCLWNY